VTGLCGAFCSAAVARELAASGRQYRTFVVLGWLVMLRRISDFVVVTAMAILIGGLGVWVYRCGQ